MKICIPKDQYVNRLFSSFERNIALGDTYNAILEKGIIDKEDISRLGLFPLKEKEYLNNPYFLNVHPKECEMGDWKLFYSSYAPYEPFVYDELSIAKSDYSEKTRFGYFEEKFPFLAVEEKGKTWMSVTPHEINTMKEAVKESHGHVISFGLGLGYYAYMALLNPSVEDVTIIERSPSAISLFKTNILPFFPKEKKLTIIEEDAFHFLSKMKDGAYDYSFVDLWHLPEDGLPLYLRFKAQEKKFKKTSFSYWVETSLLSLLRRALIILLQEEFSGSDDDDYDFAASESDILINKLHFLLRKRVLSSDDDLENLLSDDSLRSIAEELRY
ncbi:MAG: hypothetical protein LKF75_02265 [Bacilli bacterium]|jgi:hypothetical protein|nr:hypothetical protein [Bacilli bacterium]MCH4228513.1 hypothetical protein [Bacilli bacterium]MCH4277795.1 hypothetical protein [Bacilli bacterium]MCI2054965.1 hypothetical protein [Bacilli bacterium]